MAAQTHRLDRQTGTVLTNGLAHFFLSLLFFLLLPRRCVSSDRALFSLSRNSPRKSSLLDPRNRTRSRSVAAFNNSPRTAASLEYLWLLRPEVRISVEKACEAVDAAAESPLPATQTIKDLVDRCLFSARVPEQERVRDLAFVAPLWGGPRAVLTHAYNAFARVSQSDRDLLGPILLGSIVTWVEYDSSPSLDPETLRLSELMCGLTAEGDSWMTRITSAVDHIAKTHRTPPIVFPLLAPPETVRLQFLDLVTDLDRRELAEEIVQMVWRIFLLIRPVEWMAYACRYGSSTGLRPVAEDRSTGCENILSLIQFTKSLQHWIRGTLAIRKDKGRVVQFWVSIAELCLSVNGHHPCFAIWEALEVSLTGPQALVKWPEGFPAPAVAMFNRLRGACTSLPTRLEHYMSLAVASTVSTDRHPHVPPLSRILAAMELCVAHKDISTACAMDHVVGIVELVQYVQQGIRHYGVSAQPLSHDMHDLLQEMPLLPEPLLKRLAEASLRGLCEPDGSSMDVDTSAGSSERRSSDFGSEASGRVTPPQSTRTPSPLGGSPSSTPRASPQGTPRASVLTPRANTPVRVGSATDRADLGLSISYRVLTQKGSAAASSAARGPVHVLFVSESGRFRFEEEPMVDHDPELLKFSVSGGLIKVMWVRGLKGLARLLTGTSPIGFLPNVVDDVLFSWRLVFTQPSQLLKLVLDQYSDVPAELTNDHLNPNQIFGLDSIRSVRKRVLYVVKRLADIERSNVASLTNDKELLDCWGGFFKRLKAAISAGPLRVSGEGGGDGKSQSGRVTPRKKDGTTTPRSTSGRTPSGNATSASSGERAGLTRVMSASTSLGATVFVSHFMDEFVCGSSIEWSLRNGRHRTLVPTVAPPPGATMPGEKILAENLTVIEQNAFCGVSVGELLGFARSDGGAGQGLLKWVVGRFNQTSLWVGSEITLEPDVTKRAQWILFFIRLAQTALSLGNVSLSFALLAGLESLPVVRLKKTWERAAELDSKKQAMVALESMKETFSPEGGQLQLRVFHLSNLPRVRVPFVGLWTKDVFLIDRNNATYLERTDKGTIRDLSRISTPINPDTESNDGGIVPPKRPMASDDVLNVEKLSMIADSVCRVMFFQGNETSTPPRDPVIDPIGFADIKGEEELYNLSLRREPKDAHKT